MKRKFVPIWKAAEVAQAVNSENGKYEWSFVEIENMGFCKDGVTRWYWFILPRQEDSDLCRSGMNCRQPLRAENCLTSKKYDNTI